MGVDPASVVGFGYDANGQSFHLVPHGLAGSTVSMLVPHFSGTAAATSTPAQVAAALTHQPSAAEQIALQQIAAAAAQGLTGPPLEQAIAGALDFWYQNEVKARVHRSDDSLANLEDALGLWFAWEAEATTTGVENNSTITRDHADAVAAATAYTAHVADFLLARCTGARGNPFGPLADVSVLQVDLVSRGVDQYVNIDNIPATLVTPAKPLPAPEDLAAACLHIAAGPLNAPSAFVIGRPAANTVSDDLEVDFWNGPARADIPLDVELFSTGNATAIDTQTVTTGHYQAPVNAGVGDEPEDAAVPDGGLHRAHDECSTRPAEYPDAEQGRRRRGHGRRVAVVGHSPTWRHAAIHRRRFRRGRPDGLVGNIGRHRYADRSLHRPHYAWHLRRGRNEQRRSECQRHCNDHRDLGCSDVVRSADVLPAHGGCAVLCETTGSISVLVDYDQGRLTIRQASGSATSKIGDWLPCTDVVQTTDITGAIFVDTLTTTTQSIHPELEFTGMATYPRQDPEQPLPSAPTSPLRARPASPSEAKRFSQRPAPYH